MSKIDAHFITTKDVSEETLEALSELSVAAYQHFEALSQLCCDRCYAPGSIEDPGWRWNEQVWEHQCPNSLMQAGHLGQGMLVVRLVEENAREV